MVLTYNILLNPDDQTKQYWFALLENTAAAYNLCGELITRNNVPLNIKNVHKACYHTVRETYPTLPAQSVIRVQREMLSALRSIRSNKHKDAAVPERRALSLTLDKHMYSRLTPQSIAIMGGTPGKRATVPFVGYDKLTEMFSNYKTCDPTIFIRNGKLYLSLPFNVPDKVRTDDNCVGVDLGIKRFFVTSDGVAFRDCNYLRTRRKIRYLKGCLQSRKTKSACKHFRKLSRRERNLSRDMQNRAVLALLGSTSSGYIILEDLSSIKGKTSKGKSGYKRKRHNNAMSQVPFAEFKTRLTNKAHLYGKEVKTVNPAYTSQTDSRSGNRDGKRLGCRYYCSDGIVLDADWNAAVNIAKKGKHPFSKYVPVDGTLRFLNGRALSTAQSHVSPTVKEGVASPLL